MQPAQQQILLTLPQLVEKQPTLPKQPMPQPLLQQKQETFLNL
jgi:hypothetical protein